ncbi:TPA: class I SAM-dependent methyltransferase [Candidatus Poribacteria bacterium]|nr:class I SAM-dependent methyltransferase [Candidatus Poribacteria bacterium]
MRKFLSKRPALIKSGVTLNKEIGVRKKFVYYNRTYSYWESRAQKYLEEPKQKVLNVVTSILRSNEPRKVLDIGSGPAYYAVKLAKNLGCQITCLDFSEEMLKKARDNVNKEGLSKSFDFIRKNIVYATLPIDSFDAVTFISVLHYLLPEDIELSLKKSYTTLKEGGKIIIVEYWANEILTEIEKLTLQIAEQNRVKYGIEANFLKENDYKRLLKIIGFKNIKVNYVREKIYLGKYFEMNPKIQFKCKNEYFIRVAIFEATKIK